MPPCQTCEFDPRCQDVCQHLRPDGIKTKLDRFLEMVRVWVERDGGDMDAALAWMYADGVCVSPEPSTIGAYGTREPHPTTGRSDHQEAGAGAGLHGRERDWADHLRSGADGASAGRDGEHSDDDARGPAAVPDLPDVASRVATLLPRIDAAIQRIVNGQGCMRIPADLEDPDLVLADCKRLLSMLALGVSPSAGVSVCTSGTHDD